MTQRIGGRVYNHYWRISQQVSALIRQGEEEHLADAERAYNLTYKLIADTINATAGQRFGPAPTPREVERLAEAELAKRLPSQLGTDPRTWVAMLNRLLGARRLRRHTCGRNGDSQHVSCYSPGRTVGRRDRPRIGAVCPFVRLVSGVGDHITGDRPPS